MLDVRPIGGVLGAEVTGIDLSTAPPDDVLDHIVQLLDEFLVLFFPDQHAMTDPDHEALLFRIGREYVHPLAIAAGATRGGAKHIVDDEDHPPFQNFWHTDVSWDVDPPTIGSLRSIEMPERGGDTLFASTRYAYDTLTAERQEQLSALTAHHDLGSSEAFRSKAGDEATDKAAALMPDTRHPVVGVHPRTGRKYLYVNRQFTRRIIELDQAASDQLLTELCDHIERTDFVIRHRWTVGTLCLWDERSTLHYAAADHFPARREMSRVVVRDLVAP